MKYAVDWWPKLPTKVRIGESVLRRALVHVNTQPPSSGVSFSGSRRAIKILEN